MGGLLAAQWVMAGLVSQRSIAVETMGARVRAEGMSSPVRMRFWNEAWMMFLSAPIFGIGFKEFAWNNFLLTAQIPGPVPNEGIIDHAHNLIFQIAAEFGACGLIVLLGGVGWWGWSMRRVQIDPPLWWMAAALGVLGLHSMLEYPLWYAYFLGIVAVVMGAAEREAPTAYDRPAAGSSCARQSCSARSRLRMCIGTIASCSHCSTPRFVNPLRHQVLAMAASGFCSICRAVRCSRRSSNLRWPVACC